MQLFYSLFGFFVAILVLVSIHEFGHFWAARRLGVKVHRFSVGFGKPLKIWRLKNDETEYVLAAIPLGGYVKMLDERVEDVAEDEKHMAFNQQSLLARTAIVSAGPLANFLFAIVAMWGLYITGMQDHPAVIGNVSPETIAAKTGFKAGDRIVRIDDQKVYGWQDSQLYIIHQAFKNNTVRFVLENESSSSLREISVDLSQLDDNVISHGVLSRGLGLTPAPLSSAIADVVTAKPAQIAGLQSGDLITRINDQTILNWQDLVRAVSNAPGQMITVHYLRDGQNQLTSFEVGSVQYEGKTFGQIGVYPVQYRFSTSLNVGFAKAVDYTWRFTVVSLRSLMKMISRELGPENLSGPITIASIAGTTAQRGISDYVSFLVIISISLGLINLLPIPMLDGGHLLYFMIEAIKGSPVSEKIMLVSQQIGIAFLLLLMSLAFYNDIIRLIS